MYYTLKTTTTYRVPTVDDALRLRKYLEQETCGELSSFKYATKYIKVKGEVVDEYQLVTVSFTVDNEKEPEGVQPVYLKEQNNEGAF